MKRNLLSKTPLLIHTLIFTFLSFIDDQNAEKETSP